MGVLPGTEDVCQGEARVVHPVQLAIRVQVVADRLLGYPVGRHRPLWVRLADREVGRVGRAVDGAAARSEHDLRRVGGAGAFHDVKAPEDVDGGVPHRIADRHSDVGLGSEVEHQIGPAGGDEVDGCVGGHVVLVERQPLSAGVERLSEVVAASRGEVVEHIYHMSVR